MRTHPRPPSNPEVPPPPLLPCPGLAATVGCSIPVAAIPICIPTHPVLSVGIVGCHPPKSGLRFHALGSQPQLLMVHQRGPGFCFTSAVQKPTLKRWTTPERWEGTLLLGRVAENHRVLLCS